MPSPPASYAVEVQNLRKFFRVPGAKPRGRLNRIAHPVQRGSKRTLRVLDGVTFDVKRGELFGIVGRNGSGKSTLLRVLGSIYSADAGIVRITGTLAPFIELGVGFQPQMSARQNVAMNGVLLGLDRRDVKHRVDEVLAYAELEDFADVQLKNFSSGMRVRLAFASMLQADPDIYLIDEILAVGDEAFREKCMAEFATLKERNKTILMVTHRHGIIQDAADRALLLREGRVALCGDPTEVLDAYRDDEGVEGKVPGDNRGRLRDDDGERKRAPKLRATVERLAFADGDAPRLEPEAPIRVEVEVTAIGWVKGPILELAILDDAGTRLFVSRDDDPEGLPVLKPGEGFSAEVALSNPLVPGRYTLECVVLHSAENRSGAVSEPRTLDFRVGGEPREGLVELPRTVALSPSGKLEPVS